MKREPEPRPDAVVDAVSEEARGWPVRSYHAAGGVVIHDGSVLLLHRHQPASGPDEVRLPKGHAGPGESAAECAIREVQEEAGLRAPTIAAPLGTVESRFAHGGERFVRYETWFLMTVDDPAVLDPEPQFEPVWYPLAQGEHALSYEAERLAFRWACAALARKPSR
jgi:8-oxo-dGTP pyrophosphatase MutT (NUDIX family)